MKQTFLFLMTFLMLSLQGFAQSTDSLSTKSSGSHFSGEWQGFDYIDGPDASANAADGGGSASYRSITITPSSYTFSSQVGRSVTKVFKVTGKNLTSSINLVAWAETHGGEYSIYPKTLPKTGGTVTVTYTPTQAGSSGALFSFKSGTSIAKITVSGKAVKPVITVSESRMLFAGYLDTRTLTVKGTNLTGSLKVTVSGSYFKVGTSTITVQEAKIGKKILVQCVAPRQVQRATGTITISGGGASPVKVFLSYDATGNVPRAALVMPDEDSDGEPLDIIIGEEREVSDMPLGNSSTGVEEMAIGELARDVKIYAEGQDIVIETPVEQSAIVSDIAGHARRVNLQAGRNVIPAGGNGVHIVRVGEKSAKLMLR